MPSILVSLISDQFVPNLVLIKHKTYDQYWFVTTDGMEKKGKTEALILASGINREQCVWILVPEDSSHSIYQRLREQFEKHLEEDNRFDVHTTGGTKMMMLATHTFFADKPNTRLVHKISIKESKYTYGYHVPESTTETYDKEITLEEYLTASGTKLPSNFHKKNTLLHTEELTQQLFAVYRQSVDKTAFTAAQKRRSKKNNEISADEKQALNTLLVEINYPRQLDQLENGDYKYLSGDWFEEWTYTLLKKHLQLHDDSIGLGLQLQPIKESESANNEFDVLFVYKHTLYIIECKTSLHSDAKGDIFTDTIYKMATLRTRFGLTPTSLLFTLDDMKTPAPDGKRNLKDSYEKRAGSVNIIVCDGVDLRHDNPFEHEPLKSAFR